MSRRRVILHAGLHKTGTTALQKFLFNAGDKLDRQGFIYPHAGALGWLGGGHHNIAWELAGDHRHNVDFGTIDDLAAEIAASDLDAIVSAEDLESIIDDAVSFAPLREHPALRDREFTLILYVRSQAAYVESLYLEMLHHGVGAGFAEFAAPVLRGKKIKFRDWAFHFDYRAICANLVDWGRLQVIVRNYHGMDEGSVITDFLRQFGMDAWEHDTERANPRDRLSDSLRMFFIHNQGREPSPREIATIERIAAHIGDRPVSVSTEWRQRFAHRYDEGNRQLCAVAGIAPDGLLGVTPASADSIALERLFHPGTIDLVRTISAGELSGDRLAAQFASVTPAA